MAGKSWKDPSYFIEKLFVEESCLDLPYTLEIIERTGLSFTLVPERGKPNDLDADFAANLTAGKRQLFLCENRGTFFKPCPGTKEYRCCDYQVLSTGMNCPIDCAYCILQAYLNSPWLTHYVNIEKMFEELDAALLENPETFYRIGTGEFTDSLAIDRFTCLSKYLVSYFATKTNAVLELKTKSAVIKNLSGLQHNGRTVVAWSLNSPSVMKKEELRSATLDERLAAAAKCADMGYRLAFHFDPIIDHPGWREGYSETVRMLYETVPADAIAWISMGALRYIPSLKDIGMRRFPHSNIYFQEFIEGLDNKSRYFRPERVKLYCHIYEELKKKASSRTCIYFCMESDEIWKEVMGYIPEEMGGIPRMLDRSVAKSMKP